MNLLICYCSVSHHKPQSLTFEKSLAPVIYSLNILLTKPLVVFLGISVTHLLDVLESIFIVAKNLSAVKTNTIVQCSKSLANSQFCPTSLTEMFVIEPVKILLSYLNIQINLVNLIILVPSATALYNL